MTDDLPEYLIRKKGEVPPMPDKHLLAIWGLTEEQANIVWQRCQQRSIKFPKKTDIPDDDRKKALIYALLKARMDQADVIMAMVRETSTEGVKAIEQMVGKPITRLEEKARKARDARPDKPQKTSVGRKKTVTFSPTQTIHLLVKENPKRKGGAPYERFAKYVDGMSIADALSAGVFEADVVWDVKHKFIELHGE
jgi:hypothetical protein